MRDSNQPDTAPVLAECSNHYTTQRVDRKENIYLFISLFVGRSVGGGQQLGQGALHGGGGVGALGAGRGAQGGRELRLSAGLPAGPLAGGRHGVGNGHPPHRQDDRGVPRQDHEHILNCALPQGS